MASEIGRLIRGARRAQDMTQAQLADALGVSAKQVGRWESGRNAPAMT